MDDGTERPGAPGGRLRGRSALVTGGAGGIGAAIARRLAQAGAEVAIADLVPPAEPHPRFIQCDVRDRASVEAMVAAAGPRHIVIHAAGSTGGGGPFLDLSTDDWHRHIATNLTGSFHVCQCAARAMRGAGLRGSIVTLGSVNSFAAERGAADYAASKGGLWLLTRAMAIDLAPHGIRANMIAPGPIRVARNAGLFDAAEVAARFRHAIPLGRAGVPEEVAGLAEFLASDDAAYVTGSAFTVDGGTLAQLPI